MALTSRSTLVLTIFVPVMLTRASMIPILYSDCPIASEGPWQILLAPGRTHGFVHRAYRRDSQACF